MTDEEAREWARYFIAIANDDYEYSLIYEDEDFTEDFPDDDDWRKVHDMMRTAKIEVTWDD